MSFTCLVFSIRYCLALCRTASRCLCTIVLQWSLCCTVLWTTFLPDGSSAVPIDGNLEICSSYCSHGGSGWSTEVDRKSGSSLQSLFLLNSTLCKMSQWTPWAASLSSCRVKPVVHSGNYLSFLFYIYLYCTGWILNSSFSSQCRACCKSLAIVQRLVHPPGCALLLKCWGILCASTEMHWLLPGGAFCWKPVNLTFQAWNWNYRGN